MPAVKGSCRTAGEGLGRTARVHVSEESHCGIVPMKHSNKNGTLSAESAGPQGGAFRRETTTHMWRFIKGDP